MHCSIHITKDTSFDISVKEIIDSLCSNNQMVSIVPWILVVLVSVK